MHIIISVHFTDNFRPEIEKYLVQEFRAHPKTYFVDFPFNGLVDLKIEKLKEKFQKHSNNFFSVKHDLWDTKTRINFDGYSAGFNEVLQQLQKKLGEKEGIQVTYIGGTAHICLTTIQKGVMEKLAKKFGARIKLQKSYVPLVYGASYPNRFLLLREKEKAAKQIKPKIRSSMRRNKL